MIFCCLSKFLCPMAQVIEISKWAFILMEFMGFSFRILKVISPYQLVTFFNMGFDLVLRCCNPTLAKCGGEAQHSQSWGFGVLRDSRMFRVRQQRPKHLSLGCSWCHWKGLEAQISKMASHWSFGHLQPKLWAKERSGVKLVV